ncbi:MAG: hypothetical protein WAK40_06460 [Thermoplasmata archaeon]
MNVPYSLVFLALLAAYMVYSEWAGFDSRYVVGAALVLLVVAAVADAAGATGAANSFAEYVFFLLAAGVVLLLVDHVRSGRTSREPDVASAGAVAPERPAAEPAEEAERPPDHPLDRPQQ